MTYKLNLGTCRIGKVNSSEQNSEDNSHSELFSPVKGPVIKRRTAQCKNYIRRRTVEP